jgi:hypothetical protein
MESDNPMTAEERKEFDELKSVVDKLTEQMAQLTKTIEAHTEVKYDYIDDIPEWGRNEISWLISKGYLKGTDAGLRLNYDMLRENTINARAFEDINKSLEEIKIALARVIELNKSPFEQE